MNQDQKNSPDYQAQAILSRRDHSEYEIRTKLKRKKFTPDQISQTVNKLKKLGLVNDQQFSLTYAQSIISFKPVGPNWIRQKLHQKRINESIIDQTINSIYSQHLQSQLIAVAAADWRRTHSSIRSDQQKLLAYLIRRGFDYHEISAATKQP